MFHFEKMIFFEWYYQGHRKVFLCIETKFIFQNKCLKKAINITCTSIYTYVKKAEYMYISTSTHCPYPFHEKEHSWNLIFTYCAGEISSVIEIKSSWFLTIHDGMVVDFIKEQLVKCWHFSSVHECSSLTMYYFTASCYLRCLIPLPAT